MKNLFNNISQEERNRILEMHSGKKNVISEQIAPQVTKASSQLTKKPAVTKSLVPTQPKNLSIQQSLSNIEKFCNTSGFVKGGLLDPASDIRAEFLKFNSDEQKIIDIIKRTVKTKKQFCNLMLDYYAVTYNDTDGNTFYDRLLKTLNDEELKQFMNYYNLLK
jgi:hypothetical protein